MAREEFASKTAFTYRTEDFSGITTTFTGDFDVADAFGAGAVVDTFKRSFGAWRDDVHYLANLVIVLNHKIWEHAEAGRQDAAKLYQQLWQTAEDWAFENLDAEEIKFFLRVTD